MDELVITHDNRAVTTSLKVAEIFGKEPAKITRSIEQIINESGTPKVASEMFVWSTYVSRGKRYPMYYMNRDGFTLLAMGFTGSKAMQFKLKYIEAFNSMEAQIKTGYVIPGSFAEALKLAATQAEQLESQKPKVLFADSVATSNTTILIGDLAKVLRGNGIDIGQNRLFEWLRTNGYLINRQGTSYNMPTQKSMDLDLFRIKETAIQHSDGHITVNKTSKVTGKGQQYFINKFLKVSEVI